MIGPGMTTPSEIFLATMFSGPTYASPETGLLVASSTDGVYFRNIRVSEEPIFISDGGLRDPMLLYRDDNWYMVFSYGDNIAPLIFISESPNLLQWTPVVTLRLTPDTEPNYIDVPSWGIDPEGNVHIIACTDATHNWVEINPLNQNPATWDDPAHWSGIETLTDYTGTPIIQGNSFVDRKDNTYYMAYNDIRASVYYMRTSASLITGWSDPRELAIDSTTHAGDSENLVFLADGTLRFYISNGNHQNHTIWCVDSPDLGVTWSDPRTLEFTGFAEPGINWAQIVRVTDQEAFRSVLVRDSSHSPVDSP